MRNDAQTKYLSHRNGRKSFPTAKMLAPQHPSPGGSSLAPVGPEHPSPQEIPSKWPTNRSPFSSRGWVVRGGGQHLFFFSGEPGEVANRQRRRLLRYRGIRVTGIEKEKGL